jgi:hypothetical protein
VALKAVAAVAVASVEARLLEATEETGQNGILPTDRAVVAAVLPGILAAQVVCMVAAAVVAMGRQPRAKASL